MNLLRPFEQGTGIHKLFTEEVFEKREIKKYAGGGVEGGGINRYKGIAIENMNLQRRQRHGFLQLKHTKRLLGEKKL